MVGEFFREVGVLMLVFIPLERGQNFTVWDKIFAYGSSILLLLIGIHIEGNRGK